MKNRVQKNEEIQTAKHESGVRPVGWHKKIDDFSLYTDSDLTPVRTGCLACKGHVNIVVASGTGYKTVKCKWCNEGAMTSDQVNAYIAHGDDDLEQLLKKYVEG